MRPKILVLTKLFWPQGSGGELATHLIVKDTLSRHFDVIIVSGTRSPEPGILKHARYVYWSALEASYKPVEWVKAFTSIGWIRRLVKEANVVYIPSHTLISLAISVKKINPTTRIVLHLHNYQLLTYTSILLAGREPDVATDVIVELGEHKSLIRALLAGFGHYLNYINRLAASIADRIICVSHRQCEVITRHMPGIKGKTEVIYNPPPPLPPISKRISDEPVLIYAGGASYTKGFQTLLKALAKILGKHRAKAYVILGEASPKEKDFVMKLAEKVNKKLIPLDRLPHNEYLKLHEYAWALLFPSISEEPLGYAVVESMLIGTIPVASRVGGVPEIVAGTIAERFLFEPGNVEEFVDRIESLVSLSKGEVMDIGMKLKERASKLFDKGRVEHEIANSFMSLLT
jgi:glycosyltransferase involved in cell wall biosynthesis